MHASQNKGGRGRIDVVVLASGRGSNFAQIVAHNGIEFSCNLKHLICDRANVGAEKIAQQAQVASTCLDRTTYASRADHDTALLKLLQQLKPDLILTLGYMRILSADIVHAYANQIINIHPSLLPAFPGLHAQQQAWDYGVKTSGATTHFVSTELDAGAIICQRAVARQEEDTLEDFTARILAAEHSILVQTVAWFCSDASSATAASSSLASSSATASPSLASSATAASSSLASSATAASSSLASSAAAKLPANKKRALISVSDKTGLQDLATFLVVKMNFEILASGNTWAAINKAGLPATRVEEYTGFPEILAGRVKTLHPKIHAGILARRASASDQFDLRQHNLETIDLVVANLYPFRQKMQLQQDSKLSEQELIEFIDIGGMALLRAAAKNFQDVTVIVDPQDYLLLQKELLSDNTWPLAMRRRLAAKVFHETAGYEQAIANALAEFVSSDDSAMTAAADDADVTAADDSATTADGSKATFAKQVSRTLPLTLPLTLPPTLTLHPSALEVACKWKRRHVLPYGENAHQQAALYSPVVAVDSPFSAPAHPYAQSPQETVARLSYNNFLDIEAARRCQRDFQTLLANMSSIPNPSQQTRNEGSHPYPSCCINIIKHQIPCGIGLALPNSHDGQDGQDAHDGQDSQDAALIHAWEQALACDPISAYGGVIFCSERISEAVARCLRKTFLSIVCAPEFAPEAKEILSHNRPNLHLLCIPVAANSDAGNLSESEANSDAGALSETDGSLCAHRIDNHWLMQTVDQIGATDLPSQWQCVSERKIAAKDLTALGCAWCLAKNIKSNAIVIWQPSPDLAGTEPSGAEQRASKQRAEQKSRKSQKSSAFGQCIGIGSGQPNRARSAEIAMENATRYGHTLVGSVAASDGFFPFADTVRLLAKEGIHTIVQPGGSKRDHEVIQAADELGICMVFTGTRHFLH